MANNQASSSSSNYQGSSLIETKTRVRPSTILGDDNFGVWKWNLKYNLKTLGVYECVTRPDYGTPQQQDEAMLEIISSIDDKNKTRVSYCKTPYELYQAIESFYTNKTSFQATSLHMRLSSFRFKSGQIAEGISDIQNIVARLKNLQEPVSDHMVEGIVLAALPPSFRTFITVWKGITTNERTLANLFNRIMAEVEDNRLFHNRDDKALFIRKKNFKTPNKHRSDSGKNTSNVESKKSCRYCKKPGHVIEECRKLKRKKEEASSTGRPISSKSHQDHAMLASNGQLAHWIADSGASSHMTARRDWIRNFEKFLTPREIFMADNTPILAYGSGSIRTTVGTMYDVLYMPDIATNLFSITAATNFDLRVTYNNDRVTIRKGKEIVLTGQRKDGLYLLEIEIVAPSSETVFVARPLDEWHRCLGHISNKVIKAMANDNIVEGLEITNRDASCCEDCAINKGHAVPHKIRSTERATKPGTSLHLDTVGPSRQASLNGSKYFVLCKDEASAYRKVGFIECKSEIPNLVKKLIIQSNHETRNQIARICTDNGAEYVNQTLCNFLKEHGITHSTSSPYIPQQNGLIERDIRTVQESARTMINSSKLPEVLWAEAVNTAVHILNRVPTTMNPKKTPYEIWFGRKPNIKNLRIFGQRAVVNKPLIYRNGKWDTTGQIMRLVGYTDLLNTYRFYNQEKDRIVISCDVTFLDNELNPETYEVTPNSTENNNLTTTSYNKARRTSVHESNCPHSETMQVSNLNSSAEANTSSSSDTTQIIPELFPNRQLVTVRNSQIDHQNELPQRSVAFEIPKELYIRDKPPQLKESRLRVRSNTFIKESCPKHQAFVSQEQDSNEPLTFKEAIGRRDGDQWKLAMADEINSLGRCNVWKLVPRPRDTNIVTNRWVFKIKKKPDGVIDRYRARLVARGFTQVHGVDYSETYAPVANMPAVRLLFANAAIMGLKFKQFDIKTAFLYGNLEETVYMEQPEGFEDGTEQVCLLKKSLYGLKQAPRQWNKEFSNFLKTLNLKESLHDRCVYYRTKPSFLLIVIYVDDGLIFSKDEVEINKILHELKNRFEVHEADSTVFLGFQIISNQKHIITLHQESYINKMLTKYNMTGAKSVDNPSTKTTSNLKLEPLAPNVPYREAVGSLMYAANSIRLDIAYAVNRVSRNVSQPTGQDWSDVKRIFRYLSDKQKIGITYGSNNKDRLVAYCDADFAGDPNYHSTTGFVILFGGAPIHWKCQKQPLTALSSTEAELISLCTLAKELVWIKNLASEIGIVKMGPTKILCDNQSAIRLAHDEGAVHRTRHMGVRAAYVRELIQKKEITVEHIRTEEQAADFLTKPLTSAKFDWNRGLLMFLTLICLIASTSSITFESTSPIIWLPTTSYVDAGVIEYDLIWVLINPCKGLRPQPNHQANRQVNRIMKRQVVQNIPMNPPNFPPQPVPSRAGPPVIQQAPQSNIPLAPEDSLDRQMTDYIINECDQMWDAVFMSSLNDLKSRAQLIRPSRRPKRSIIDAIETTTGLVCAGCITNLISSMISRFIPHSDHNRIVSLEERQNDMNNKVIEFENEFNITREIEKGVLESLIGLNMYQRKLENQMQHLAFLMPRISWTSAFIQQKITTSAADLKTVVDEYSHSRVACKELSIFLGLQELADVDNHDTRFEFIQRLTKNMLHLKFIVRKRSTDTFVYKVAAFRYWDNLTETPSLMEYRGYNYLIHNESSNCLKAIEEPSQAAILEECKDANYTDPRLSIWDKLLETRDIYRYNHTCQVKRTMDYNYIYCFPFNITTKMGVFRNPPHVYRLPLKTAFELPIMKYSPIIRVLNISGPNEFPAIDSTHMGQFPMGSEAIDEVKWFDKMQALMIKNEELIKTQDRSISIEKHGGMFWFLITLIVVLVITTVALITYNIHISQESTQRHARMAIDLRDLKSNYCEVIRPECEHCIADQRKGSETKEKVKFSVGNDTVNIVVNRPLPSKPCDDTLSLT